MKSRGVSWNRSAHHKRGITDEFSCSQCSRKYKQSWTRENHQKLCKER